MKGFMTLRLEASIVRLNGILGEVKGDSLNRSLSDVRILHTELHIPEIQDMSVGVSIIVRQVLSIKKYTTHFIKLFIRDMTRKSWLIQFESETGKEGANVQFLHSLNETDIIFNLHRSVMN